MNMKTAWVLVLSVAVVGITDAAELTAKQLLGKELLFADISDPPSMSCTACHAPNVGFTGPTAGINLHGAVYRGAVPTRFGNRKPPSAAYAATSPLFQYDRKEKLFLGGNFWDGRATGWELGNPAADQAQGPFLNPVEQNMPSESAVCERVRKLGLTDLYEGVWGWGSLDCNAPGIGLTYDRIALSIAAYEDSTEVNQFSSKYDAFLAGKAELTAQEAWGLELFEGKAMCSACHISEPGPNGEPPLFTDYTFDNLGVPKNPENPFYGMNTVYLDDGTPINPQGMDWVDYGLGGFLRSLTDPSNQGWRDLPSVTNVKSLNNNKLLALAPDNDGKQKVPTLRNVGKGPNGFPKAYMHNGYFKTLEGVVSFYNTRDKKLRCPDPLTTEADALKQDCWPKPEVDYNVNTDELGDLGLTPEEEAALVAFMMTLSDGYFDP